ncbi:MAG TPA: hypothetical protein VGF13_18200 [Verrucomicrobiae bacterium]|jgi:hypothetical protein
MPRRLKLEECFWVRSPNSEHPIFMPITRALQARGAGNYSLRIKSDPESLPRLKEILWKSDAHVVLHGLLPGELRALKPVLVERKNYSMVLIDWWTSPWWFARHAENLFYNLYNGIAVRSGQSKFIERWNPPLLSKPELMIPFHIAAATLRPIALMTWPFRDLKKGWQRQNDNPDLKRLFYFPIPVNPEGLPPLQLEAPAYDFSNTGSTYGIWLTRNPYASAKYDFANIYRDRERLIDVMLQFEGRPYTVFDRRPRPRLSWEDYCRVVRQSRYAISTGGLHEASIPKFLEYVCLGTPVIGRALPFEYPLLRNCIFNIDSMTLSPAEMKTKLDEALAVQPKLKENCLAVRDKIIQLYDPQRILDLLQDQLDGKPIPSEYVQAAS